MPIGPTAAELLTVLQPQMNDLKTALDDVRDDTKYLRECAVRNAARIEEHEKRINSLETKGKNGGSNRAETKPPEWERVVRWILVSVVIGAALVLGYIEFVLPVVKP